MSKSKRIIVPRTRNAGTMTESQYFSQIRSHLRNAFRWWKPMQVALEKASRKSQSKNKRLKKEYKCAGCCNWFARKDVQIDHVVECGRLSCYEDIIPFIKRLTVEEPADYQILCLGCHKKKTLAYKLNNKLEDGTDNNI